LSQEGNYVIELVGWNTTNLCSDTSLITILVYDSLILNIPNVFTPNNDGVNDVFSIQSNQDAQLNVTILNRWGNSVFTGNIQLQSGVLVPIWDGGVSPDGVYFIELNVTTMKGEIIENGGFISLER